VVPLFGTERSGRGEGDLSPPSLKAPRKALVASYDWNLTDLNGGTVPFSKFRGKTVFLNFWATWCAPCVEELPAISRLADDDRLKDVVFVAPRARRRPRPPTQVCRGQANQSTCLSAHPDSAAAFSRRTTRMRWPSRLRSSSHQTAGSPRTRRTRAVG